LDSSSAVPAKVTTEMVSAPSLNSGRKVRPARSAAMAGGGDGGGRERDEQRPAVQRAAEQGVVAGAQPAHGRGFEAAAHRAAGRAAARTEHRGDGERDGERGGERDDVGEAERREQAAFDAVQEEQRREDEHDDERGEDDRSADLAARLEDDGDDAPRAFGGEPFAQAAHDVFDVDDRVVDERADRDRHAAEGHGVERGAERVEHEHGDDERERDGERGDEGRPAAEEEEADDEHDEQRAVAERVGDVVDAGRDEVGLPKQAARELDVGGQGGRDVVEHRVERSVSASVLTPGCFWMPSTTPGAPSIAASPWRTASPMTTSATSTTRTGSPPRIATTERAMSSTPPTRPRP
jgi:hypothetical protein